MPSPKKIALLGSTGSIGVQTLDVIRNNPGKFSVVTLTAGSNAEKLIRQAKEFKPDNVIIADVSKYKYVNRELSGSGTKVYAGKEALEHAVTEKKITMVVAAIVGFAGLKPTLAAINAGKQIALANKETLVVAGELVTKHAKKKKVLILPVDSEHSAIFQCLVGEKNNPIEKIVLTASGGPFRGKKMEQLRHVTREQALNHPNWNMGAKITIDSATLINKGLEVIEAHWLFNLKPSQIQVVIHPQSIIHSLVQFQDGSIKAQMGLPDMRLPIQYALSYPQRLKSGFPRYDFFNNKGLTFEKPDPDTFLCLKFSFSALEKGGNVPCILNAANEVAVRRFLNGNIRFTEIHKIIYRCFVKIKYIDNPSLEDYLETDRETRILAEKIRNWAN